MVEVVFMEGLIVKVFELTVVLLTFLLTQIPRDLLEALREEV